MTELEKAQDIVRITKRWYTEQRGRVLGNTRMWDELSDDEEANLAYDVRELLEVFEYTAKPEPTPHEVRSGA